MHLRSDVSTSRWDEHEKYSKASGFPLHWWVKKWFHRVSQFMDNMITSPQYVLCGFMPGNPRANHQLTGPRNHFRSWQPAVPFTTPFSRSKQVVWTGPVLKWGRQAWPLRQVIKCYKYHCHWNYFDPTSLLFQGPTFKACQGIFFGIEWSQIRKISYKTAMVEN